MAKNLLLGIDLGTTVLKIAVFDARTGRVAAQGSHRLLLRSGEDGVREQNAEDLAQALRTTVASVRRSLGADWTRINGIGLASQGGSGIIADRADGAAHTPIILWNDARASALLRTIAAHRPVRFWRSLTLLDSPGAGLGRLQWLQKARPELFTPENIYVGVGEHCFFALTGVWRQDAGNALQIGCYDAVRQRLDRRPLDLIDVPLSFVAPLRRGHAPCPLSASGAKALRLPPGLPVAGPYIDQEAGYMSALGVSVAPLQCSLGTAWVGNFVLPEGAAGRSPFQLVLPAPRGRGRLVVQPLLTGNVAWDWGLETFAGAHAAKNPSEVESIFAESLLPPPGLVAIPWHTQPNPLEPGAVGGGSFFGLSALTQPTDMLRALAAGMAYEFARVFEQVRDSRTVDAIVLSGGAGKGSFFRTLLSGLFAPLPVYWQHEDLSGARGSLFAFGTPAAKAQVNRIPGPTPSIRAALRKGLDQYRKVYARLYQSCTMGGAFEVERKRQ